MRKRRNRSFVDLNPSTFSRLVRRLRYDHAALYGHRRTLLLHETGLLRRYPATGTPDVFELGFEYRARKRKRKRDSPHGKRTGAAPSASLRVRTLARASARALRSSGASRRRRGTGRGNQGFRGCVTRALPLP